jgi:hypothetical protein
LLAAAVLGGGIGPSSAQDAGTGTPDPAAACATPDASPGASPDATGSPAATPILVVEATPGVDPGEASPAVEIICATPEAATPTS